METNSKTTKNPYEDAVTHKNYKTRLTKMHSQRKTTVKLSNYTNTMKQ